MAKKPKRVRLTAIIKAFESTQKKIRALKKKVEPAERKRLDGKLKRLKKLEKSTKDGCRAQFL